MVESVEDQQLVLTHFIDLLIRMGHKDENAMFKALMTDLSSQFNSKKNSEEKIRLLSVFAPHREREMYDKAKKMGLKGEKKVPDISKRERYDALKLDPYLLVRLPYGEKRTKDSMGRTVILPNTIRLMGIMEAIELYETWMRQNGRESLILSRSTTYRLMSALPAIRSLSRTCVDYFAASATMAFIRIREMLELTEMGLMDSSEVVTFKHAFDETEVYLWTDFKMHVKEESRISDHCLNHALSDPFDARFASPPKNDHQHDQKCEMCEKMDYIFRLQTLTEQATSQNEMKLLDIQHDFDTSIDKILDLKSHHVRTVFTLMERDEKIRTLQEGESYITFDFAQKWLPTFFRETQKDFFGKPGYSWHFAHDYAMVKKELVQHVYIHIFKNDVQNGAVVVEVIKHIAEDLAKMGIRITCGYYHSAPVMASINKIADQFKIEIASWSFSEAQAGKSTADRYCALLKGVMRCYIAKDNNIDTHEKMFIALTKGKQQRGVSVHLGTVTHTDLPKTKIPGISNLGHFEFDGKDTISAWKFRGIGDGMKVSGLEGIESSVVWNDHGGKLSRDGLMEEDKHKIAEGKEPHFWFFPKKNTSPEPGDVDDEAVTGEPIAIEANHF